MASLILGGIGAGIGSLFGNPMLGFNAGALLGGLLFGQSNQSIGQLQDLRVTGSNYGAAIPYVYGSTRVGGQLIWATDLVQHTQQVGGKGMGATDYTYSCTFAVAICRGPINGILRIWANDMLIYDGTSTNPTIYPITIYNGTEYQEPDSTMESWLGSNLTPAFRGLAYAVFDNLMLTNWSMTIPQMSFEIMPDPLAPTTMYSVLSDVANQCGLVENVDYDFSNSIYDDVVGFVINNRQAAYSSIEQIIKTYSTDIVECDGMLKSIRRGETVVGHVTSDDMGVREWSINNEDPPSPATTTRSSDLSLPYRYDITYFSFESLYQSGLQSSVRYSRISVQDFRTLSTSITMHDSDAADAAARLLDIEWLERETLTIPLSYKWLMLSAGSPFLVDVNGTAIRVRVTSVDISQFGILAVTAVRDWAASAVSGPPSGYMIQSRSAPLGISSAKTIITDVPSVFDAYSGREFTASDGLNPGFYVIATGGDKWQGGIAYYSTDGTNYSIGGNITQSGNFGVTTNTLVDGSAPHSVDTTHTLSVQLYQNGILTTCSINDILNGTNWALCGIEQLTYQNVAAGSSPLAFDLTTITRGLDKTTMTGHSTGERFWNITSAILRVNVDPSLIGDTIYVKVISGSQTLAEVTAISVVIATNNIPYKLAGVSTVDLFSSNPSSPINGQMWMNTTTGDLEVEYGGSAHAIAPAM